MKPERCTALYYPQAPIASLHSPRPRVSRSLLAFRIASASIASRCSASRSRRTLIQLVISVIQPQKEFARMLARTLRTRRERGPSRARDRSEERRKSNMRFAFV